MPAVLGIWGATQDFTPLPLRPDPVEQHAIRDPGIEGVGLRGRQRKIREDHPPLGTRSCQVLAHLKILRRLHPALPIDPHPGRRRT